MRASKVCDIVFTKSKSLGINQKFQNYYISLDFKGFFVISKASGSLNVYNIVRTNPFMRIRRKLRQISLK